MKKKQCPLAHLKKQKSQQRATQKYRRIKTIVSKSSQTARICGLKIVLYVFEPSKKKLKEIYTSPDFRGSEV